MASKRAAHLQKGEAPPKTKMSSFKRAMLTKPPPESAAEVFRQSKPEVLKGKMAAVHDWLSTVSPSRELDHEMSAWLGEAVYSHEHSPATRLSPSPPAPMDEVVDMTYTEVHEPEDPPLEMPTRRRMEGPVAHHNMAPTPVELVGETQEDDGAAVSIMSNHGPGMVVCDCGAFHSSMRLVTMRTRSRHRTMSKQIVCLPTLPEEAVDDDEQHPDGEESDQEDTDSGSLDDADADGNLPDPEAVQGELDELLDHVDPELARKVADDTRTAEATPSAKRGKAKCQFYHWHFKDLLQAIYSHPDVAGLMRSHATREKSEEGILEDIPGE
ncbi:hypothetical protein CYMTET_4417 [Cymbomonas tetramitiformis]|uniref:Uncharacterized protein n=1 Tax=Cymbomonas tetramitiformis TaxID=36881 RepID=A0AAE0H195_9CHLO|nr:hypothetical protein CYMTET_4417 [Cymbomonas tetramitiformis]